MTFTETVKSELCALPFEKECCQKAEMYGMLLFGQTFSRTTVRIMTNNSDAAGRLQSLAQAVFGFEFDREQRTGRRCILSVSNEKNMNTILETYGYGASMDVALHLNNAVVEDECCRGAFVRGVYLLAGSVSVPLPEADKAIKYHLEIAGTHYYIMREFLTLLRDMDLPLRLISRKNGYLLYCKAASAVGEFLAHAGAMQSYMHILQLMMERRLRNEINRKVNCETGNINRVVEAAAAQRTAIESLQKSGRFDLLPEALKETALLRIEYPELTLTELVKVSQVGRSALYHRLRKLVALAEENT
jgi:hypothetical protein